MQTGTELNTNDPKNSFYLFSKRSRIHILQHPATPCNILQHIATHYNILQHIAGLQDRDPEFARISLQCHMPYIYTHTHTHTHTHVFPGIAKDILDSTDPIIRKKD